MSPQRHNEEQDVLIEQDEDQQNQQTRLTLTTQIDRSIELEHILELPNESESEADVDGNQFSYNYNLNYNRSIYYHTGNRMGLDSTNSSMSNDTLDNSASVESDNSDFFSFEGKSKRDEKKSRHTTSADTEKKCKREKGGARQRGRSSTFRKRRKSKED